MCYTVIMRRSVIAFLLIAALCAAAETPAQKSARQSRLRDQAEREAAHAKLLADSEGGLLIVHYNHGYRGWGWVRVKNIADTPINFDYHLVHAAELETGNIVEAADIKFGQNEIASYEVKPGEERAFNVFFFGGRATAAAGWRGHDAWCVGGQTYTDLTEPLKAARKAAVAQHKTEKTIYLPGVVIK